MKSLVEKNAEYNIRKTQHTSLKNFILIAGPNGVGKTKLVNKLSQKYNAEIVNLDRTYLFKSFRLTTGLADVFKLDKRPRHFYEVLDPLQQPWDNDEFIFRLTNLLDSNPEKLFIGEGGSCLYVPAVARDKGLASRTLCAYRLEFEEGHDVQELYTRRIEEAFNEGLIEEIRDNLELFKKSSLIKDCHFGFPIQLYLENHLDLHSAKQMILKRCLAYKCHQESLFQAIDELVPITSSKIEKDLQVCFS